MQLKDYIKSTGLSVRAFARQSDVDREVMYRIFNGSDVSLKNALKIYKATEGKVTLEELAKIVEK